VKAVEKEGEELLRVLLLIAGKLRRESSDSLLEVPRNHGGVSAIKEFELLSSS